MFEECFVRTLLGPGDAGEAALGIAVDTAGIATVVGFTSAEGYPNDGFIQPGYGGGSRDAFVTRLNAAGSGLVYSTLLGGTGADQANAVALDRAGNTYLAGSTASMNFPTARPFQADPGGGTDAFVSKISYLLPPAPTITAVSPDYGLLNNDRVTYATTLTLSGSAVPDSPVAVTRHGGPTTVVQSHLTTGVWTLVTTVPQGVHTFTATTTVGGVTSLPSQPFPVVVDTTLPALTLSVPATTYDRTPEVRVVATDNFGLPNSPTVPDEYKVELYVDLPVQIR